MAYPPFFSLHFFISSFLHFFISSFLVELSAPQAQTSREQREVVLILPQTSVLTQQWERQHLASKLFFFKNHGIILCLLLTKKRKMEMIKIVIISDFSFNFLIVGHPSSKYQRRPSSPRGSGSDRDQTWSWYR